MYTEVQLSEFLIRARLKIGDLSEDIKQKYKYGENIDELIYQAADLRVFLNAVNNNYCKWTPEQLYIRAEYMAVLYELGDRVVYNRDWLDKFKPVSTINGAKRVSIDVPFGAGYLYMDNGTPYLRPDKALSVYDKIDRFKGFTDTLANLEEQNPTIPEQVWAIVHIPYEVGSKIGVKIGDGTRFNSTAWLFDPRTIDVKISKPSTLTPSPSKFLTEVGDYRTIEIPEVSLATITDLLQSNDLTVISSEEYLKLKTLLYDVPAILTFSSLDHRITLPVEMGTSISGGIDFLWSTINTDNIASMNVTVSEGDWDGAGNVVPYLGTVTLNCVVPISYSNMHHIDFTISGKDMKGNTLASKVLSMTYTHRIHYGCASTKVVSDYSVLTGHLSKLSNVRQAEITFYPVGPQYSILFIPAEIDQSDINIVNKNIQSIDHSYGMNTGNVGTFASYTRTVDGILYNVYVSFNSTSGSSTAIIK